MKNENQDQPQQPRTSKPTYSQAAAVTPTLQINMEGELLENQIVKDKIQPIDQVKVKNARKIMQPRPNLSASTHMEAAQNLEEHNQETKAQIEDDRIKMKKTQNITEKEREDKIVQLLSKASCKVGIAPLTKKQVSTVCNSMTNRGILKKTEPLDIRLQRTLRSLVKTWCKTNLKITEDDWDDIKLTEIAQTNAEDADIVFLTCGDKRRRGQNNVAGKKPTSKQQQRRPQASNVYRPQSQEEIWCHPQHSQDHKTKSRQPSTNLNKEWKTRLPSEAEDKRRPNTLEHDPPPDPRTKPAQL